MNNFFEDLKKYFENTPEDQILKDWSKSVEFDKIGPSIEEFFQCSTQFEVITTYTNECCQQKIANKFNPKFSSGFFLTSNNNLACKPPLFQL